MKKPRATPVAISLSLLLALASSLWSIPNLEAQTDPFYKGKMIRVIVCCASGGLYDQWARLFARYMGRYIPGNPNIIVQNMPGAGGIIAANYVYNVARPDGLSIAIPIGAIYLPQLAGEKEVRFDVRKFNWIGSQEKSAELFYVRTDTGFRTVEDIVKAKEPPKVSSTGAGSAGDIVPQILEVIAGAKFKIVRGYPGGTVADLAVERGEVVGRGLSIATFFGREPFLSWVKKGFVVRIAQTGQKRDPRFADVVSVREVIEELRTWAGVRTKDQGEKLWKV